MLTIRNRPSATGADDRCVLYPDCRPRETSARWEVTRRGELITYLCDRHALEVLQTFMRGTGHRQLRLSFDPDEDQA